MKKSYLVAALAAVVAALVAWIGTAGNRVSAQSPPYRPAAAAPPVAVVDIAKIFKAHPRFKAEMEQMKADVDKVKQDFRKEAESLNKMAETLQGYRPGTPEYNGLEKDLATKRSDLQARMQQTEREFVLRDAKVHYNVYTEIMQEVQYCCQANGIAVAINYNSEQIHPDIPDDVLRAIRQNVVYSHKDLDITPLILRRIAPATANATGPMGVTVPR
ncbi:MAG: OmpH family outer membrane protein [Thermoguttaceae bacterium]